MAASVMLLGGSMAPLAGCSDATPDPGPSLSEPTSAAQASGGTTDPAVTTVAPEDMDGLTRYIDRRNRFVIHYPDWWQETNLRQLGDADVYGIEVVGFADHHGPVADGCYSNMLQVNILEDMPYDESVLSRLPDALPETLERLRAKNDAVQVLEPWGETRIAGVPAMAMRLSLLHDGLASSGLDCVLVAEKRGIRTGVLHHRDRLGEVRTAFQPDTRGLRGGSGLTHRVLKKHRPSAEVTWWGPDASPEAICECHPSYSASWADLRG